MADTRKIVRAFLASPGDMEAERKAVRDAIEEFNSSWADDLGYQVELIGWEETIAGYGRPQELINQDLDRCDLFLGMLWRRWGTPPDTQGQYTSGFHEEFERAISRRKESGKPEICLFFKDVGEEFEKDPGPDLQQVLKFKSEIASKSVLYQTFSESRGMEAHARRTVSKYVIRIKKAEDATESPHAATKREKADGRVASQSATSPLSTEGFQFLERLISRISRAEGLEELTPVDIARFRLLSNSISKLGNDEGFLGVHDLNLIFAYVSLDGIDLGHRERWCLAKFGFQHLQHQTAPLWRWYASLDITYDLALLSSFGSGDDNEKVGAIRVLTALGRELPDAEPLTRQLILSWWFSDESSDRVKNAALAYLSQLGDLTDLAVVRTEYDRSTSGTTRSSLECMIQILLRVGGLNAAELLVLETQFDSLDEFILSSVLNRLEGLASAMLELGLKHRSQEVRLRTVQVLRRRGQIGHDLAELLLEDSDADIRKEALDILLGAGRVFDDSEVRRLLVRPRPSAGLGFFAHSSDTKGEARFSDYRIERLREKSNAELERIVGTALPQDDDAFFVLAKKNLLRSPKVLRDEVDGHFASYFNERIRRLEAISASHSSSRADLISKTKELEDFVRKRLTRRGLNILCENRAAEDLHRIRDNLRSEYCGASVMDAQFLEKWGEWADIELLANAEVHVDGASNSILGFWADDSFPKAVAKMALAVGGDEISRLCKLNIPAKTLELIIRNSSMRQFAKISDRGILSLLDNEVDSVRKYASAKAVESFPVKRTKKILRTYVQKDEHRYYNVIHWLDMGASLPRGEARKAAKALSQ